MSHIKNLSHITFICKDINKTTQLFKNIFGAVEQHSTLKEIFFKLEDLWLVLIEGEQVEKTYNHIAFQSDAENFSWVISELKKLGLSILEGRGRKKEEGESLYFYDYDNHLFELHSGDLDKRIERFKVQEAND